MPNLVCFLSISSRTWCESGFFFFFNQKKNAGPANGGHILMPAPCNETRLTPPSFISSFFHLPFPYFCFVFQSLGLMSQFSYVDVT
ncbi:hypothetical protein BGZ63DRAFT_45852 [Mariannaea sp. PMI_226]|nr:hypothetical protein BGZ63DRAFT_45852 [Mariannaea sp. PMI_226]